MSFLKTVFFISLIFISNSCLNDRYQYEQYMYTCMQEKYSGDSLNAITWWENFESFLVEGAYLESVSKEAYLKMFENLGSDSTSDLEILNFIAFIVEYERQEFNIRCFLEDEYSHGDFVFFEQSKWADLYKTILGLNNTIKNPRIFFLQFQIPFP